MELCLNPKKNNYVSGDLGDVGVPSSSNISIFLIHINHVMSVNSVLFLHMDSFATMNPVV